MNPLFHITLQKEHQKHRNANTVAPNAIPNQIIKKLKYGSVFRTKDFVPHKYNAMFKKWLVIQCIESCNV